MASKDLLVNLRDCMTMTFQDESFCANCYQLIGDLNYGKKFSDRLNSPCDKNNTNVTDSCSITVAQALITVLDLHRKSHLSSILLDEHKYILCNNCFNIFHQLYVFFKEFADCSSPPSYLFSILKNNPFFEPSFLLVEIKSEPNDKDEDEDEEEDQDYQLFDGVMDDIEFCQEDFEFSPDDIEIENEKLLISEKKLSQRECKEKAIFSSNQSSHDEQKYTEDNPEYIISTPVVNEDEEEEGVETTKPKKKRGRPRKHPINQNNDVEESTKVNVNVKESNTSQKRVRRQRTHICPECHIGFSRSNHLRNHIQQHSARHFVCTCGVGFRSERNLIYHTKNNCLQKSDGKLTTPVSSIVECANTLSSGTLKEEEEGQEDNEGDEIVNKNNNNNSTVDDGNQNIDNNLSSDNGKNDDDNLNIHNTKLQKSEQSTTIKQAAKLVKHAKKVGRPSSSSTLHISESLICSHELCKKVFSSSYKKRRHEAIHKEKPYLCTHCQKCFGTEEALAHHLSHSCRVFNQLSNLKEVSKDELDSIEHKRKQEILRRLERKRQSDNMKRYECFCGSIFSRTNHLRQHSLVHKESNVTCSICNAGFINQAKLDKHQIVHDPNYIKENHASSSSSTSTTGNDNNGSDTTRTKTRTKRSVVKSSLNADGQMVLIKEQRKPKDVNAKSDCSICGKSVRSRNMRIHLVSHKTERPAVCEHCGLSTERPFLCTTCGQRFKRNQHLRDHEIVKHSDARLYVCSEPDCKKTFKSSRNLRQHQHLHKGMKFKCDYCNHAFSRKDNLRVHVDKHCGYAPSKLQQQQSNNNAMLTFQNSNKFDASLPQKDLNFMSNFQQQPTRQNSVIQLPVPTSSTTSTVGSSHLSPATQQLNPHFDHFVNGDLSQHFPLGPPNFFPPNTYM